jgi:hypothetical protein
MSVTGYFEKTSRGDYKPKASLKPLDAARFFEQQRLARLEAGQPTFANRAALDPVLRQHLRIRPDREE